MTSPGHEDHHGQPTTPPTSRRRGLALVYRGPASTPGCPEAAGALLQAHSPRLDVEYVGPREARDLGVDVLADAVLYVQPGGGSLGRAYRRLRRQAPVVRDFVHAGGRYLGLCLGGYLAGRTPGFDLLPGDADRYISSAGADTTDAADTVLTVRWAGAERRVYFQDGPCFVLDADPGDARVLAVYTNGLVAALVASYGRGAVGVVGPHPEAEPDWYADAGLPRPWPDATDLGHRLLDELMSA